MSSGLSPITACKKKLFALNPDHPPQFVLTQQTKHRQRKAPADPRRLEDQVRQLLAEKVSGNQVGIWLLAAEHLQLGTWDLLLHWTGQPAPRLEPRMGMHLINEAAMCLCSYRHGRTLSQKGFELANGLPFVPSDQAIHDLLQSHTVQQGQELQIALGKLRRASQHFKGRLLAMDPHRMISYSQRQMRRHRFNSTEKPAKMGQTFFLLDCDTHQPICFTLASSAQTVAPASHHLLAMAAQILNPPTGPNATKPLVLTDKEHYSHELFSDAMQQKVFDLLCAMGTFPGNRNRWAAIAPEAFTQRWPGYATTTQEYHFKDCSNETYYELVQRTETAPGKFQFQGFVATDPRQEVPTMTKDYPDRWHVEEFFKFDQALGWDRTGTLNLNVRYGQMTMALVAQAAIYQLRQRLGKPFADWDAPHLARNLFQGLEGDVRVVKDRIVVTYYNAPNVEVLRNHYENLPEKLQEQGITPQIPWLYNFKLDFRFK